MDPSHVKINPAEIQFIKPLDQLMKVYQSTDKEYFCKLFERKKELIENLMAIGIDSEKYFALISKIFKSQSPLKQFAKADLVNLKYQHQMNKETWFQAIVVQTQTSITEQQKLYNQYKTQNQKPTHKILENKNTINLNINIVHITNIKLFDELMQKYYQTPYRQLFIELYEKKHRILKSIDKGQVSPELYFNMSNKAFQQTKNEQVKKILKDDFDHLGLICDGDKKIWLKETLKQSKSSDTMQKQIYELHKKGQIVNKRQFKPQVDLDQLMNLTIPSNTDPEDCVSFIVLDKYMNQTKQNPEIFIKLFQKKKSLLAEVDQQKLNEKTYKIKLQNKIKSTKKQKISLSSQILKQIYQSELNDILDVHDGNEKKWFQYIVDESKIDLMMQQDIYQNLKLTYRPVTQKKPKIEEKIEEKPKNAQIKKTCPSKVQGQKSPLPFNSEKMFSLKVIEDAILMHGENPLAFVKLFNQKQKMVEMMKNGQLNAEKYKKLQQKMLTNFADNQTLKEEIQMDLEGINDFYDGDVNKWFQQTVERAGEYYETQHQKYLELIKDQPNKSNLKQESQKSPVKQQNQKQIVKTKQEVSEPFNINKLFSLKVLDDALAEYGKDQKLYIKIFTQKQKIIEMMQNGKIDALKYKKLQQKMMDQFKENESIKDSISFELDEINDMHDGDVQKWFKEVVQNSGTSYDFQLENYNKLLEKYKDEENNQEENLQKLHQKKSQKVKQSNKKQFESKVSQASSQINQSTPKSKIRYYLHEMAPYESLINYFQKHNLNPKENPILKIYFRVPRQEIDQIIQKIQSDPSYDIVSYCQKFFPPISPSIFYQGVENYEEKLKKGAVGCNKEIQSLKQYSKMLRKGLNVKNLQKVKQRIHICQQNIKYLSDLAVILKNTKKLIPLPLIEQVPVSYPSIDQNSSLEQNEVELKILKIEGLDGEHIMKVYFSGTKIQQLSVKNGSLNLQYKQKIQSSESFIQMMKGDLKCFSISIYKSGWFSKTKIGQQSVEMMFIRSNIHEGKVQVGNATIFYEARVKTPKNPLLTEIKQIRITKYPLYEQSKQVEQQFIKKYTPQGKK